MCSQRDYTATRLRKGNPSVFPGRLLHHFTASQTWWWTFLLIYLFLLLLALSPGACELALTCGGCGGGGGGDEEDVSCWHKFGIWHVIDEGSPLWVNN